MSAGIGCNSLWVVIYCTQILFVIFGTFSVLIKKRREKEKKGERREKEKKGKKGREASLRKEMKRGEKGNSPLRIHARGPYAAHHFCTISMAIG